MASSNVTIGNVVLPCSQPAEMWILADDTMTPGWRDTLTKHL